MTVLFYFDHQINPYKGGTERVTDLLAHYLKSMGVTVYYCARYHEYLESDIETFFLPNENELFSGDNITFLQEELRKRGIEYIINQASNGEDIYLFNHRVLQTTARIISVLHFSVFEGLNYFKELQLLEFHWTKPKVWLPNIVRIAKRAYNKQKALEGKQKRFSYIYDHSDAVVVLSDSYIDDYKKIAGLADAKKLHAIPNPLTYAQTSNCKKDNLLLFVGRLSFQEKRLDRLMHIWKLLYKKYPDWKLNIVGDGHDRVRLEQLADRLGLERIYFEGMRDPKSYYDKAKIFCMTSTHEGLPMVLLEAMQNKVIPFAFDSFGAASDIISDGVNGCLIPAFDLHTYAARLEDYMGNSELLERMSSRTTDGLEKYDISSISNRWLHLFEELK